MAAVSPCRLRNFVALAFAATLSACGGGSAPATPLAINSFSASPTDAVTGHRVTLSWSVSGATSLTISGIGSVSGTHVDVNPTADTDYVLTASNSGGSITAHAQVTVYPPPVVWFAPFPFNKTPDPGVVDFFSLFNANAPWAVAASHIQVFKLYEQVMSFPDASLKALFADLRRRHIALALEFGPLLVGACGGGIEGFRGDRGLQTAQRIRDLGGALQYVAFDEPDYFGALYDGPNACRYTPDQVVQNAMQSVNALRSVFPDLVVGDIEVVPAVGVAPDWLDQYQQWLDAWTRITGSPLAFLHVDVPIDGDWHGGVEAMRRAVQGRNLLFGVIYVGEGNSDAEWVASAEQFASDYENKGGTVPDQKIFQSWIHFPTHALPETDPTTFTYAIDRYFRTRTQLTLQPPGSSLQGQLLTGAGAPVTGAAVNVTATPLFGTGQLDTFASTGTVPTGTQTVTFGARVNLECAGSGPSDLTLSDFTLDAGAAGVLTADFTNQLVDWGTWGTADTVAVNGNLLHVALTSSEYFGLNHVPQTFAAEGAAYQLRIRAAFAPGSSGNGCLIAVFQNATGEISRQSLFLQPQPIALGAPTTANDGTFVQDLSAAPTVDYGLWALYPGSPTLWPSAAFARVAQSPLVSVATTALPAATAGQAYSAPLTASGGKVPYLWVGSGLPPGLALLSSGSVAGTPTTKGIYTVNAIVIDDATPSGVAQRQWSLTVQ